MLHFRFRTLSHFYSFQIDLASEQIKSLQELTYEEVILYNKDSCIDSFNIEGFTYNYDNFINCPLTLSTSFIKYLVKIPISYVHEQLKKNKVIGSHLIKYKFLNKIYVTDGEFVEDYNRELHDKKVRYVSQDCKYFLEQSIIVGCRILPLLIIFFVNYDKFELEEQLKSKPKIKEMFQSDPTISSKYEETVFNEAIKQFTSYFSYLAGTSMRKKNFFLCILIGCIISEFPISLENLVEMIQLLSYDMFNMYATVETLSSLGIKNPGGRIGESTYYIK